MPKCAAWGIVDPRSKIQRPQTWTWDNETPPTDSIDLNDHSVGGEPMRGEKRMEKLVVLHRWEAGSRDDAARYFTGLRQNGIPHSTNVAIAPARVWRYRGAPYYLDQQMERLKLTLMQCKRARDSNEFHRISGLLGQLSEQLVKAMRNGDVILDPRESAGVNATLEQCDDYVAQLFMTTAAAAQAVDEARAAYKLPPKPRPFEILSEHDVPSGPPTETNGESHHVHDKKKPVDPVAKKTS